MTTREESNSVALRVVCMPDRNYPDFDTALRAVGWHIIKDLSGRFALDVDRRASPIDLLLYANLDRIQFRDCLGLAIPIWRVRQRAKELGLHRPQPSRWARARPHTFRYDPVPCTSSRSSWRGFRRPRTSQERRENAFVQYDEDLVDLPIKARKLHHIPTGWDDIPFSCTQRTWKKHRRTQWKM